MPDGDAEGNGNRVTVVENNLLISAQHRIAEYNQRQCRNSYIILSYKLT